MGPDSVYAQYCLCLRDLLQRLSDEEATQSSLEEKERSAVVAIESEYSTETQKLQSMLSVLQNQYQSVHDSCQSIFTFQTPRDMRPLETDSTVEETAQTLTQAFSKLKSLFDQAAQNAREKRMQMLFEQSQREAALQAAAAERERIEKERAAREEMERGAQLIEEMKRKHKRR